MPAHHFISDFLHLFILFPFVTTTTTYGFITQSLLLTLFNLCPPLLSCSSQFPNHLHPLRFPPQSFLRPASWSFPFVLEICRFPFSSVLLRDRLNVYNQPMTSSCNKCTSVAITELSLQQHTSTDNTLWSTEN